MELIVPQVVDTLLPVLQPGEFEAVLGCAIPKEYQGEGAVRGIFSPNLFKAKGLLVKGEGCVEIGYVEVIV